MSKTDIGLDSEEEKNKNLNEKISQLCSESNKQFWLYFIICCVCIAAIGAVAVSSHNYIIGIVDEIEISNWWELLFLRTPLAVLFIFVLLCLYNITKSMLREIIGINEQRRRVISLSVLVTAVHESSSKDINLSEEKKYSLKVKEKYRVFSRDAMFGRTFIAASRDKK